MKIIVRLTGFDKASLMVKYLTTAARKGLKSGSAEGAQIIVEEAKTLVPVDTGRLRDAIHADKLVDEPERQGWQVAPFVAANNKWGFDPPYARRIEYGFVGQDSLGRNYHQAAQPYMRPAVDTKQDEVRTTIKTAILEEMDVSMAQVAARRRG
jgi:hypothetical protein